ncbi:MAG: carboxypeptidase regulatory-like domain-containing protein, partial [Candidatus Altiarchaeota archaeon]|nr:carboxypeptidase regulatory-like domain-containing protein [Candidatus Altiarchaeota archaeon]
MEYPLLCMTVIVILSTTLALAEENQSLAELFPATSDALGGVIPPDIGDVVGEESPKLMAAPTGVGENAALAEEVSEEDGLSDLMMEVRDFDTTQLITDVHIQLHLTNKQTGESIKTIRFVGETGRISLKLAPGIWSVVLKLDDLSTPGKDYFSELEMDLRSSLNVTAFIQPVGSVIGSVVDSSGKLIVDAQIKLDCDADHGDLSSITTDSFGSFSKDWL